MTASSYISCSIRQSFLPSLWRDFVQRTSTKFGDYLVWREEVRCTSLNEGTKNSEASTMVAWNRPNQKWPPYDQLDKTRSVKSTTNVAHCNQIGHTKSRCFKLIGFQNGGTIIMIHRRKIITRLLLLQWLKQRHRMMLLRMPRH